MAASLRHDPQLRLEGYEAMNRDIKVHQVPGTPGPFLVDGFKHARASPSTTAYFLSHFHSDHYGGLDERFNAAPIYCTQTTASLVAAKLGVAASLLRPQRIGEAFVVEGVAVTFVDANHCPGAVLLLFELPCGRTILHCGDMRYHPRMQAEPALLRVKGSVDTVYLDTTYCEEKHTFPPQEDSIARVVEQVAKELERGDCLVLLSAYTIGKEKVLLGVSRATGHPIYVSPEKMQVLQCLELKPEELQRFTGDMSATPIHVTKMGVVGDVWPFFQPKFASIKKYIADHDLPYSRALGVIPTGWAASSKWNRTHSIQTDPSGCVSVMLSPYSEHSNFPELQEFVAFIRPAHIIPTVYSDERAAKRMVARFAGQGLLNTTAAKRGFLALFSPSAAATPSSSLESPLNASATGSIGAASVCDDHVSELQARQQGAADEWAEAEAAWLAAEKELDAATSAAAATAAATSTRDGDGDSDSDRDRDRDGGSDTAPESRKRQCVESSTSARSPQQQEIKKALDVVEGYRDMDRDRDRDRYRYRETGSAASASSGLQTLLDMGFGRGVAERALRVAGGDVEAAVASLLYRAQALG